MPSYAVHTTRGTLDDDDRRRLASAITRIHAEATGAPQLFIHVAFPELEPGATFTAGEVATPILVQGYVRAGRPQEIRESIMRQIFDVITEVTGAPALSIVVSVMDFPAQWAMEGGFVLPEPDSEAEDAWLASVGHAEAGGIG